SPTVSPRRREYPGVSPEYPFRSRRKSKTNHQRPYTATKFKPAFPLPFFVFFVTFVVRFKGSRFESQTFNKSFGAQISVVTVDPILSWRSEDVVGHQRFDCFGGMRHIGGDEDHFIWSDFYGPVFQLESPDPAGDERHLLIVVGMQGHDISFFDQGLSNHDLAVPSQLAHKLVIQSFRGNLVPVDVFHVGSLGS